MELCDKFETTPEEIKSLSRKYEVVKLRWKVSYILSEEGYTQEAIGKVINRDRSTVSYYMTKYTD